MADERLDMPPGIGLLLRQRVQKLFAVCSLLAFAPRALLGMPSDDDLPPLLREHFRPHAQRGDRVLTMMPCLFFALLRSSAAIVALFYRVRLFLTPLVHLHASAVCGSPLAELAKFDRFERVSRVPSVA